MKRQPRGKYLSMPKENYTPTVFSMKKTINIHSADRKQTRRVRKERAYCFWTCVKYRGVARASMRSLWVLATPKMHY